MSTLYCNYSSNSPRGLSINAWIVHKGIPTCCCTSTFFADLVLDNKPKTYFERFTEVTRKRPAVIEDNAPCHRANIAAEARQVYVCMCVCFMILSLAVFKRAFLRGQHLSPIENVWRIVKCAIAKQPIAKSVVDLQQQVEDAWDSIPLYVCMYIHTPYRH
jgi:hypothetical protein